MTPHPSLGSSIEGFYGLSNVVRLYVRSLRHRYGSSYLYKKREDVHEDVEFGKSDPKDFKKSRRKKKKKKKGKLPDDMLEMLHSGGFQVDDVTLMFLAGAAACAASRARELAGGDVVWCCGCLRIKSEINYSCTCDENEVYRIVNKDILKECEYGKIRKAKREAWRARSS